jgi:hypothetical protein
MMRPEYLTKREKGSGGGGGGWEGANLTGTEFVYLSSKPSHIS